MRAFVHDPGNKFSINEIWAFVSRDDDGNEGVVGATMGGVFMPLIAADKDRLDSLRPLAKDMLRLSKKKIFLVKFSQRSEIEEIV